MSARAALVFARHLGPLIEELLNTARMPLQGMRRRGGARQRDTGMRRAQGGGQQGNSAGQSVPAAWARCTSGGRRQHTRRLLPHLHLHLHLPSQPRAQTHTPRHPVTHTTASCHPHHGILSPTPRHPVTHTRTHLLNADAQLVRPQRGQRERLPICKHTHTPRAHTHTLSNAAGVHSRLSLQAH